MTDLYTLNVMVDAQLDRNIFEINNIDYDDVCSLIDGHIRLTNRTMHAIEVINAQDEYGVTDDRMHEHVNGLITQIEYLEPIIDEMLEEEDND